MIVNYDCKTFIVEATALYSYLYGGQSFLFRNRFFDKFDEKIGDNETFIIGAVTLYLTALGRLAKSETALSTPQNGNKTLGKMTHTAE